MVMELKMSFEDGGFGGGTVWIADCRYKRPEEEQLSTVARWGRWGITSRGVTSNINVVVNLPGRQTPTPQVRELGRRGQLTIVRRRSSKITSRKFDSPGLAASVKVTSESKAATWMSNKPSAAPSPLSSHPEIPFPGRWKMSGTPALCKKLLNPNRPSSLRRLCVSCYKYMQYNMTPSPNWKGQEMIGAAMTAS